MRRIISFIVALGLTAGGLYLLVYLFVFAPIIWGWQVAAAGFMTAIGAMWLWSDYIAAKPNR